MLVLKRLYLPVFINEYNANCSERRGLYVCSTIALLMCLWDTLYKTAMGHENFRITQHANEISSNLRALLYMLN